MGRLGDGGIGQSVCRGECLLCGGQSRRSYDGFGSSTIGQSPAVTDSFVADSGHPGRKRLPGSPHLTVESVRWLALAGQMEPSTNDSHMPAHAMLRRDSSVEQLPI